MWLINSFCRCSGCHDDGGWQLSCWCTGTVGGWTAGITTVALGQLTSERWWIDPSTCVHTPQTELTLSTWGPDAPPPPHLPLPGDRQLTNQKPAPSLWCSLNVVFILKVKHDVCLKIGHTPFILTAHSDITRHYQYLSSLTTCPWYQFVELFFLLSAYLYFFFRLFNSMLAWVVCCLFVVMLHEFLSSWRGFVFYLKHVFSNFQFSPN